MLTQLIIRNLVIVRELELSFSNGMSAFTGETGAGKSIMIDALGLTLGTKTDNSMIRDGCDKAEVSSDFDLSQCPQALAWLEAHDLLDDSHCILRRVLVRDGRSRAYINGSPSPQALLKELGELILNIHGQHAHQSLLKTAAQRQLLDDYANLNTRVSTVSSHYLTWQSAQQKRNDLQKAANDRANRIDYLEFQLSELAPLVGLAKDIDKLTAEHAKLAHAEQLQTDSGTVLDALDEGEKNISSLLGSLSQQLASLCELDSSLKETQELIESANIQIGEATQNLRYYQDNIQMNPEQLQNIDQQLAKLHDLARKHHVAINALPLLHETLQQEFNELNDADQILGDLDQQVSLLEESYYQDAKKLRKARKKAAVKLSKVVTESMQQLGMVGGIFKIDCDSIEGKANKFGIDNIEFLVAANPGQTAAALASVASGGELSRISLAIQVATADYGSVPSLIFDEVDVGIGGAVAEIVGQLLRNLGDNRQVLCVTHLPQVASQAHQHYRVHKMSDGKTTETRIDPLTENNRVDEIARMLGGVDITEQTVKHAGEMINRAQQLTTN